MLYVNNLPSQAVQPVKTILKKKSLLISQMQLRISIQGFNFYSEKN